MHKIHIVSHKNNRIYACLSIFEDKEKARETLDRVREFCQQNPTVYCSTHCPEVVLNVKEKKIIKR